MKNKFLHSKNIEKDSDNKSYAGKRRIDINNANEIIKLILKTKNMSSKYFIKLAFLILSTKSFGQTTKLFTKNVNVYVETDLFLVPIEPAQKVIARADFYWDKTKNSGNVKITDLVHNKVYNYPVNQLYTNFTNGYKIFYFQTTDGKEKISVSKE